MLGLKLRLEFIMELGWDEVKGEKKEFDGTGLTWNGWGEAINGFWFIKDGYCIPGYIGGIGLLLNKLGVGGAENTPEVGIIGYKFCPNPE